VQSYKHKYRTSEHRSMQFTNWYYKYIHSLLCCTSPIRDRRIKIIMADKTEVLSETRYRVPTVMYHKRRDFWFGHCPQSQAKEGYHFRLNLSQSLGVNGRHRTDSGGLFGNSQSHWIYLQNRILVSILILPSQLSLAL